MKTPDDFDRLLDDVLTPDHPDRFRDESLQTVLSIVRSRKRRRQMTQATLLLALPLVLAGVLWLKRQAGGPGLLPAAANPETFASSTAPTIPGTDIRLISDDDLFALFPGRAMALIGPKDNQELVFLDEPARPDGLSH